MVDDIGPYGACRHCGHPFLFRQWSQLYCSATCRVRAWQARVKLGETLPPVVPMGDGLSDTQESPDGTTVAASD
jgi:hypothetical protein